VVKEFGCAARRPAGKALPPRRETELDRDDGQRAGVRQEVPNADLIANMAGRVSTRRI